MVANTTGIDNTAMGVGALDACTTGSANIAIGNNALGSETKEMYVYNRQTSTTGTKLYRSN